MNAFFPAIGIGPSEMMNESGPTSERSCFSAAVIPAFQEPRDFSSTAFGAFVQVSIWIGPSIKKPHWRRKRTFNYLLNKKKSIWTYMMPGGAKRKDTRLWGILDTSATNIIEKFILKLYGDTDTACKSWESFLMFKVFKSVSDVLETSLVVLMHFGENGDMSTIYITLWWHYMRLYKWFGWPNDCDQKKSLI